MATGEIKTKRWCDPRDAADGFRLLVCRYRPRALKKELETWDAWDKNLGPSKELHADYYGKHGEPISFAVFSQRYRQEMKGQTEAIQALADRVAAGETITLLCSQACTDPELCHRSLLKELVEERIQKHG